MKLKYIHKKQLKNTVKNLNRIICAIREYIPEAAIFFNGEGILSLNIHSSEEISINNSYAISLIFSAGNIKYADCGGY